MFSVTLLIWFFLGWRESMVVAVAIPVTLALTLSGFYFLDYTLNRITLFALIFSIGILVDFIQLRQSRGMPLKEAVTDAGAVRFRPMLLTALTVVVGSSVILMDPILQGMAISLMAGEIAALIISRAAVPVIFYMVFSKPD